jgi:hypothetical protein
MGFGRIIGYIFSVLWILSSLLFLPLSLVWIWAPFVIIIVLRRQAKREVRMEEYEKRQTESLERMSNKSQIININAREGLDNKEDEDENNELKSKDDFWVYDKKGKPLMKIHREDKSALRAMTEQKIYSTDATDTDTDSDNSNNKRFEED